MRFRFSELVTLRQQLQTVTDLRPVKIPPLPPKFDFQVMCGGRFNESFQEQRFIALQRWFAELATVLNTTYGQAGCFAELCEPFRDFVGRVADRGGAAEALEVANAARMAEVSEDREIVQDQNREYEEALQIDRIVDEQRQAAERDRSREGRQRQEAEALEAQQFEEARQAEVEVATSRMSDRRVRRETFVARCLEPAAGEPSVQLRVRGAGGKSIARRFAPNERVSAVFEWAAVTEWDGAPLGDFDLTTAHPTRSLLDCTEHTLTEAGLAPSAALLIRETEED